MDKVTIKPVLVTVRYPAILSVKIETEFIGFNKVKMPEGLKRFELRGIQRVILTNLVVIVLRITELF